MIPATKSRLQAERRKQEAFNVFDLGNERWAGYRVCVILSLSPSLIWFWLGTNSCTDTDQRLSLLHVLESRSQGFRVNEPNDENWIASSVCRQFTKQQKCKSLCTTNNNRPKTELCGTPQAWCATQQTTSMIWTKSRRNLKVRGATRELTNQRRAALSLTHKHLAWRLHA